MRPGMTNRENGFFQEKETKTVISDTKLSLKLQGHEIMGTPYLIP